MKPTDIILGEERLLAFSFLLAAIRAGRHAYPDDDPTDTLIRIALIVATLEGRPLGASELAESVGVPRETVRRRLRDLQRRGRVEIRDQRAIIPKRLLNNDATVGIAREVLTLHDALARSLLKLEPRDSRQPYRTG
jgi:DNA-binding transcriptional ArsR family regulator